MELGLAVRGGLPREDSTLFFAPNYFEQREEKDGPRGQGQDASVPRARFATTCLEYALEIREAHGIWGGLNEYERRQLLRAAHASRAG